MEVTVMWILIFLLTAIAFYTDHTRMIIPNWLSLFGTAAGLGLHTISGGLSGLWHSMLGLAGISLFMLVMYFCKGVEAGDVKLFAAFGAIGGFEISLYGLMYSLIAAAFAGIIIIGSKILVTRKIRGVMLKRIQFPFMYAVVPGFLVVFFLMEVYRL